MATNSILTTTVGSYPVPIWLRSFGTKENLRDAIMVVLKTQELAGIDVIADGELYRWDINHPETNGMIDYFIRPIDGIKNELSRKMLDQFRRTSGMAYRTQPAGMVVEKIEPGTLNLLRDFELVRPLTRKPLKLTLTSPYMLGRVLINDFYESLQELVFALADVMADQIKDVPADVIQIDEANLPGNPDSQHVKIAAESINRIFKNATGGKGVHLCFGNYGGQTIQKGSYEHLVAFINALECDHVILEMARRPKSDRQLLKDIKPEMGIGAGVIDIKDNQVESADQVAKRIEEVANIVGPDRIKYVHPDCGFWMLPRTVADAKMSALVKGRDAFLGQTS